MPNLRDVNWLTPVNLGHSLNVGRALWLLGLPNVQGSVWRDLKGQYPGTLTNFTSVSGWRPVGLMGGTSSLLLDGVDDYVDLGLLSGVAFTQPFTVAITANPANSNQVTELIGKILTTGNLTGWILGFGADAGQNTTGKRLVGYLRNSSASKYGVVSTADAIDGLPHRYAAVFDPVGRTIALYQDGQPLASSTDAANQGSGSITITNSVSARMGDGAYAGAWLSSPVDNGTLWTRGLSDAEIKADYDLGRLGYYGVLNYSLPMMRRFWALGGTAWTQSLTESFSLTDSRIAQGNKALNETLSLTDARVLLASHALLETLSISDLHTLLAGKVLSDSFAITDSRASSATKTLSDALILTDARASGAEKTLAESVPLVEARSINAAHLLSEALSVTDSLAESLGFVETLSETLALSDARASAAQKTLSETLAISDARASDAAKQLSETLSLSDVLASLLAHFAAISEALTLTETRAVEVGKPLSETLALSEALDATTALLKALSETLTFTDTRGAGVQKALSEPLVLSDVHEVLVQKSLLDSLLLTDSLAQVRGIVAALSETLSLTDTLTALRGLFAALTETIPLTDSRLAQMGKSLSEALTLTDSKSAGAARALAQILEIEDARAFSVGKPLSEALTLSDLVTGSTILFAILTETLTLTDTRESSANKALSESFDLEEAIAFGLAKHLEETVALADMTRMLRGVLRLLTDIQSGVSTQDALLAVLDAFTGARVEDEETSRVVDDSAQSDITF